jgi:hypothetical protein
MTAKSKRNLRLLAKYKPEVRLWLVFSAKKDLKKLSGKLAGMCERVMTVSELTRGIF